MQRDPCARSRGAGAHLDSTDRMGDGGRITSAAPLVFTAGSPDGPLTAAPTPPADLRTSTELAASPPSTPAPSSAAASPTPAASGGKTSSGVSAGAASASSPAATATTPELTGIIAEPGLQQDTFTRAAVDSRLPTLASLGTSAFGAMGGVVPGDAQMTSQVGGYLAFRERDVSIRASFLRTGEATHASAALSSGRVSARAQLDTSPTARDARLSASAGGGGVDISLSASVHEAQGAVVGHVAPALAAAFEATRLSVGFDGATDHPEQCFFTSSVTQRVGGATTVSVDARLSPSGGAAHAAVRAQLGTISGIGDSAVGLAIGYDSAHSLATLSASATFGQVSVSTLAAFGSAPAAQILVTVVN